MVERSQGSINIKKVTKMVRRWETVWYGMTEKVGVFKNNNNKKNLPDHAFHWHPIRYWLGKRTLPAWQFGPPPCLSESPLPKYCYTPIFPPLFYHPFISSLHNYLTQFTKMQIWQHHFSAKSHSVAPYDLKDKWVSCCQANLQGRWRCWFLCVMYHLFLPFSLGCPSVQCLANLQFREHTVLTRHHPFTFVFACARSMWRCSQVLFPANLHLAVTCPILTLAFQDSA